MFARAASLMATRHSRASISLRSATPNDVDGIATIERLAFSDPWPASAFRELIEQSHARVVVAHDREHTVRGYCVLLHVLDEGEIANIAVALDARKQGIAARLLDDALNAARQMGLRTVYLEVRVSNDPARMLYDSRGFIPIARRRAYYREPLEDALVLRWTSSENTSATE